MTDLSQRFLKNPIAHRALHDASDGRPENSLPAVQAAIDAGYGIEIDIQGSSDAQAMVFHDYDLTRLTRGDGAVRQQTTAALTQIPLCGSLGTIPTLFQVLDMVAGQTPVLIEIKDQDGALGKNVGQPENAVAAAVANYNGDVAVMSFNPHSIALMAEVAPNIPRGLVTGTFLRSAWPTVPESSLKRLRDISDFDRVDASFISHRADDLGNARVADIKTSGAVVLCWTIRDEMAEIAARKFADNITFEGYLPKPATI